MLTTMTIIKAFLNGIKQSKVATAGAVITVVLFPLLVIYAVLEGLGVVENPQIGFIVYGGLTWLFILGHVMVFVGLFIMRGKDVPPLFSFSDFKEHFAGATRFNSIRKLILFVAFITFFNFLVIGVTAYNGFHYSESVDFCAKLCHTVMMPEYTAYQNSPHSRVACVECHIGTGAKWFIKSKLAGSRQLLAVTLGSYAQPILTPIHGLRPARETCEECHRPELFHGDKLKVIDKFLEDEENTHVQTVLLMKVGSGEYRGQHAEGIHGAVSPKRKIIFKYSDYKRKNIGEVKVLMEDGSEIVYATDAVDVAQAESHDAGEKAMDCLDCHNRPTHIYRTPEEALDQKLLTGEIPRELPYIKRQALEVVTQDYASHEEARTGISQQLREWYSQNYPSLMEQKPSLLEKAIVGVIPAYTDNVFPQMKIDYGTYKNYLGHRDESGCFRCHDELHVSAEGKTLSQECDTCHLILAEEEPASSLMLTGGSAEQVMRLLQGER
jgi:nitrate/TMAO reductase-like tetraheme cytochrome c subunit